MSQRRRLDIELVRRGLAETRSQASQLIADGRVLVGGAVGERASRLVASSEAVTVTGPPSRFVGRGGEKLLAALGEWPDLIDMLQHARAIDCGASTGGFTDCMLQHGASHVVAVDVGHGQLHERIRSDQRVLVLERTDIRNVDPGVVGGSVDFLAADLSFISLRTVAGALVRLCKSSIPMVMLVKPQFEVGRQEVSRGRGVITDDTLRFAALSEVIAAFEDLGCTYVAHIDCPVHGAEGNREFLLRMSAPGGSS